MGTQPRTKTNQNFKKKVFYKKIKINKMSTQVEEA